ncbi:MAG: hypothetical protein KIS81_11155 [Maricaulaceae bacterium]|nr:hypothetical protein [Maricaulaceae bacterium]
MNLIFRSAAAAGLAIAMLAAPAAADERLYGSWVERDEPTMTLVMRPDGRGEYLTSPMRWEAEDGLLSFFLGEGGFEIPLEPMNYDFEGGLLKVWHEELYPNPTFWRRTGAAE